MADDPNAAYGDLPYVMSGLPRRRNPYDARRQMAMSMVQGGMDFSPVQHPLQGASRLAQALVGTLMMRNADSEEAAADKARQEAFGKIAGIADPQERIAALGKIDPEAGARYAGQIAMQELAAKRKAAEAETAARAFGGGMDPGMGGGQQQAAMPPEQAKAQAMQHAQYLIQNHGFSPEQAAAMVGNLYQESGFNPTAVHDNGTGFGMGGWRLERRDALLNFAKQAGRDPRDPQTQLDFFATELKGRPEFAQFQQAQTPQDRQNALMTYFRPAGWTPQTPQAGHGYGNRVQFAQTFAGGQPQVAQGDNVLPVPRPVADGSGNPLPPQQAPRPTEIPRPAPDPELRRRLQQMIATQQMTVAEAQRREDDDINRRWQFAQQEAGADNRLQLQLDAEARREAAKQAAEDRKQNTPSQAEMGKLREAKAEAETIINALDDYKAEMAKGAGVRGMLGGTTPQTTAYNNAALLAKGEALFNLGVLNGPDLDIIRRTLPDPSTVGGSVLTNAKDREAAIEKVKNLLRYKIAAKERAMGIAPPSPQGASNPAPAAPAAPQGGGGQPDPASLLPPGFRVMK